MKLVLIRSDYQATTSTFASNGITIINSFSQWSGAKHDSVVQDLPINLNFLGFSYLKVEVGSS